MIRTDSVLTLRDLRGEHQPEVRTIPWGTPWEDFAFLYVQQLFELGGIALRWRQDDVYPVPEGRPTQRDEAVAAFVKELGKVIAESRPVCLRGADCSLLQSWEPSA